MKTLPIECQPFWFCNGWQTIGSTFMPIVLFDYQLLTQGFERLSDCHNVLLLKRLNTTDLRPPPLGIVYEISPYPPFIKTFNIFNAFAVS